MIPILLSISGFLSYHDPVTLDFSGFDLACISGPNGAGKSSLLDAITWALFGQARRRDDALINNQSQIAEVNLTFAYEGNIYQVQRANPRGKTTLLEFHILLETAPELSPQALQHASWKPLTERTLRETQACIDQTLRLDYDTFVNASFFLQGKADQFTQQRSGDRKRILSSILGLEVWETYRQRSAERRKMVESDIAMIDGQLKEINDELAQEKTRKARLKELQSDLENLTQARSIQEEGLETIRAISASLAEQRKMVATLARQLETTANNLQALETRAEAREEERANYAEVITQGESIQAAYQAWQEARQALEAWDEIAARFRDHEKRRQKPLDEINATRARLVQEQETLQAQESAQADRQSNIKNLETELNEIELAISVSKGQLARRDVLDEQLQEAREVGGVALHGVVDGARHRADGGLVQDDVCAAHCPRTRVRVRHIARDELETLCLLWCDLGEQLARFFRVPGGVLVEAVEPEGPADKAGVKAGDIITRLDDMPITGMDVLFQALDARSEGDEVTLGLVRREKHWDVKLTLAAGRMQSSTVTLSNGDSQPEEPGSVTDGLRQIEIDIQELWKSMRRPMPPIP